MPQKRDPVKEKYWRRLLRQWRRSGWTPREFCDQQGISQPSFYAWRREIALRDQPTTITPQATTPTFVKLALEAAAPSAVEIVLADGRLLRVRSGCDTELLRQLLRLLEEPSC
jgi:transposase